MFLIGINHEVQYTNEYTDVSLNQAFAKYLGEQSERFNVTLIAEEFNIEAGSRSRATAYTAKDVADKLGIGHRFCDPNSSERKALGIPREQEDRDKNFRMREQLWFDKIKDKLHEPIIFICGSDHVERFQSLVLNKSYEVTILVKNWCEREKDV